MLVTEPTVIASVTLPVEVPIASIALLPAATHITIPSVIALRIASSNPTETGPLIDTLPTAGFVV